MDDEAAYRTDNARRSGGVQGRMRGTLRAEEGWRLIDYDSNTVRADTVWLSHQKRNVVLPYCIHKYFRYCNHYEPPSQKHLRHFERVRIYKAQSEIKVVMP